MSLFDAADLSHRLFYHRTRTSYLFGCIERLLKDNPTHLDWSSGDIYIDIEDETQVEILNALIQASIAHKSALIKKYLNTNDPEILKRIKTIAISHGLFSLELCTLYNSSAKLDTIVQFI